MQSRPSTLWLILAVPVAIALGSGTAAAQGPGVQLGGGPIFASLDDAQGLDLSTKTGWLVGLLLGGNRDGLFGVETDLLYGEKGAKFHVSGGADQDFTQRVLHVPVMLKLNAGASSASGLRLFGLGGTYLDWQFSSKINDVDIAGDTNGFEVGWVLGGGIEALRFSLQARYVKGVGQISKDFDVASAFESDSKAFVVLFAFRVN